MKNLFILLIAIFSAVSLSANALKFSPFMGVDYGREFGSATKPFFGVDFSYEFNNGLEFGFGTYASKTKVASYGEEIRPNYFTDYKPEVKETPIYLLLKYNYYINENSSIAPYGRVGQLRTSIYNNYENIATDNPYGSRDFTRDDTIFYGNNFYAMGLQYTYKRYYLAVEYKVRMLEQESLQSNVNCDMQSGMCSGTSNYSSRTFKASSVSFLMGFRLSSKDRMPMNVEELGRRFKTKKIPAENNDSKENTVATPKE
ncbi:MAG: porin family protein [Alphaproteobacteria bacterium]|jgi:hypothetical protein|nr:porin family protein [Alphaproteobacteria bacterium]